MPDPRKENPHPGLNGNDPGSGNQAPPNEEADHTEKDDKKPVHRGPRNIVPIILSLALFFCLGFSPLRAQMDIDVSLGATYSDNVFQLSEHDLGRWEDGHPSLDYAETTDDLALSARIDLAYPLRYRWWTFTPSVSGIITQNVSNQDKQRRDALLRFRVDRYYWNFTALYGYYPHNYVRSYIDSDGTGELEEYSYERNLWRGDLNLKPFKGTTVQFHGRLEDYYYNQFWTEADGHATTLGVGLRQSFPLLSIAASYRYRVFDNSGHDAEDGSYESNLYSGTLSLKDMPLSDSKPRGTVWHPSLTLSYEERFFQSLDDWYGGRADKIYNLDAGFAFTFNPRWKLLLDYSHTFRNVETPVSAVRLAREFGENRLSATVKYSF